MVGTSTLSTTASDTAVSERSQLETSARELAEHLGIRAPRFDRLNTQSLQEWLASARRDSAMACSAS